MDRRKPGFDVRVTAAYTQRLGRRIPSWQRAALATLLASLRPAELAIPDTVLTLMAPGAALVTPSVELFGSRTRPAFDELGAARTPARAVHGAGWRPSEPLTSDRLRQPLEESAGRFVGLPTVAVADGMGRGDRSL